AAPTAIPTLSLHDALPILVDAVVGPVEGAGVHPGVEVVAVGAEERREAVAVEVPGAADPVEERGGEGGVGGGGLEDAVGAPTPRSEEHTSELQSRGQLVCR